MFHSKNGIQEIKTTARDSAATRQIWTRPEKESTSFTVSKNSAVMIILMKEVRVNWDSFYRWVSIKTEQLGEKRLGQSSN